MGLDETDAVRLRLHHERSGPRPIARAAHAVEQAAAGDSRCGERDGPARSEIARAVDAPSILDTHRSAALLLLTVVDDEPREDLAAQAAHGRGGDDTFGRAADLTQFDNQALDSLSGNLELQALASATGGVSVTNIGNFGDALDRILARSSYYLLAYRPSEPFNGKFHKLEIKVGRPGAKVYSRSGFVATADKPEQTLSKEQTIIRAAMSPLARRDVDLNGTLQLCQADFQVFYLDRFG